LKLSAVKASRDHHVYLGIGSNISPEANIPRAIALLRKYVEVETISTIWESPPAEGSGPNFLNAAVLIRTDLDEEDLRSRILRGIEAQLGRIRTADQNAPRTIDLDILIYDGQVLDDQIWLRAYLALPLSELIPDLIQPTNGKSLKVIAERLIASTPLSRRILDLDPVN
jgi:2-amino-4-hydroxy-6-hydroxymethyldihydropteridine diphosphokinase